MKKKRGLSPVIATVLLISMVIVIGMIIFLWFRNFQGEVVTKFDENIKLVCEDIDFDASYSGGTLFISNDGNVPIFDMRIKLFEEGSHTTEDLAGWPSGGLNSGSTYSKIASQISGSVIKITLIPVLIGSSEKGDRSFMCEERFGRVINV